MVASAGSRQALPGPNPEVSGLSESCLEGQAQGPCNAANAGVTPPEGKRGLKVQGRSDLRGTVTGPELL